MKFSLTQKLTNIKNHAVRILGKKRSGGKKKRSFLKGHDGSKDSNNAFVVKKYRVAITLGSAVLIVLFFIYLIDNIVFFVKLDIPEFPDSKIEIVKPWNGNDRLNIAVIGLDKKDTGHTFVDRVLILHINPDPKKLGIFATNTKFISDLSISVSDSIKNSYILAGESDKGLSYTISSVEQLLGIKIDRYVVVDNQGAMNIFSNIPTPEVEIPETIEDSDFGYIQSGNRELSSGDLYNYLASDTDGEDESLERLVKLARDIIKDMARVTTFFALQPRTEVLMSSIQTNLSKKELIHLFLFLRELRSDQIKIAYTRDDVLNINGAGDEVEKWVPVYENIDRDLSAIFDNPGVRLEQAKIEILNATNVPGLASSRSRLLENAGCRVVRVGNTSNFYDANYIYVKNPDYYQETIKEVKAVFSHDIEVVEDEYPYRHIGDLVIIIADFEE